MNSAQPNRMTLIIIMVAMAASVGIYALLVYVIHPVKNPNPDIPAILPKVLAGLAFVCFAGGIALESLLLGKASVPGQVQTAAIVSCALGEAIAVLGLVLYFVTGETGRFTPFLIGAAAYFAALFLRLPPFLSRMDGSDGESF